MDVAGSSAPVWPILDVDDDGWIEVYPDYAAFWNAIELPYIDEIVAVFDSRGWQYAVAKLPGGDGVELLAVGKTPSVHKLIQHVNYAITRWNRDRELLDSTTSAAHAISEATDLTGK